MDTEIERAKEIAELCRNYPRMKGETSVNYFRRLKNKVFNEASV